MDENVISKYKMIKTILQSQFKHEIRISVEEMETSD
jgi:hypothetical protein